MSVTTTANPATYNLQSVLAEYDLHHTEETHDPSLNAHPNPNSSAQNPSHWPTDHRRVPAYRPINTALDQGQRRVYLNTGEQVFVGIMFTGVFLESAVSKIWRASLEPSRPLNITICGAGIGGLSAAIFLRKQGHAVTLLEASRFANELGAAVHLAPNANGLLRRMGYIPEQHGAVDCLRMSQFLPTGKQLFSIDLKADAGRWLYPWQLAHRVTLHSELKRMATCEEGQGPPAVLRLRSKVVDVDAKEGVVILEGGERVHGDVIVGADGVHSRTRPRIPGAENVKTFGSGKSAFRFLISRQKAYDDPDTRKFADQDGHLILTFGRDRRVVVYPTSDNTLLNFVCIHPTAESQIQSEEPGSADWQNQGNLSKMLEVYKDWEPAMLKLLSMADEETLKVWELLDMEQLPTWTEEKLVLIGDAAHPFTPHQGQGAGQAIQDAASLAVMLPPSTPLSTIPARLKLYEKCRFKRASTIQEFSRLSGRDLGSGPPVDAKAMTNYNFGHDEWDYSTQMLREWETVLQGLLPRGSSLQFAAADTAAYATFAVTQLHDLEWLGGRGYNHFGLYIHGVQHTSGVDGSTVQGTYLPILFENLADPILSGRDELGFPKVFADVDFKNEAGGCEMTASWMGSAFCKMSLGDLQDAPATNGTHPTPAAPVSEHAPPPAPKDTGLLLHKYIPATAPRGSKDRGQADVEYTTYVPDDEEAKTVERKVERTLKAGSASISFDALDWKALPTLHHVVGRLAEIPVYES
ncbi:FabG, Dehydrogenase [Pyrenophora tritici-repentis]|nr:FabG, Dehydrogenase [Pyrenophora tritici-repentis]